MRIVEKLGDPEFGARIHGWFTIFWFIVSIPLVLLFGNIVAFVSWLSVYAIVVAHWSSWQAVRTEVAQSKTEKLIQEALERIHNVEEEEPDVTPLEDQ